VDNFRDTSSEAGARASAQSSPQNLFAPRPLPLQIRLLVLIAGTLVPMLMLTAAVVFQSYERAKETAAEQVLQITRSTMVAVDRELQNQIAGLEVLALAPSLQSADLTGFRPDAERFLTRFPPGTAIAVADATGAQLFHTSEGALPALVRPEVLESIAAVFAGRGAQVSNVYLSRRTGEPTFTVSVPVMRGNEVLYALAFNPPRPTFDENLRRLDLPPSWVIAIIDRAAHHVARRPALAQAAVTSISESLKAELATGADERLSETTSLEGTRVLSGFTRSRVTGWVVAVGLPVNEYRAPTQRSLITTFSIGALLILVGGFFAFRIASQLVRAEGHRELLGNELNHRVKNTLSSVQAIVWRGLRNSGAAPEVRQGIDARLQALSSAHNVLSRKNWEGARLEDLVKSITEPYAGSQALRVRIKGPAVALQPRVAIAVAMIVNELATNAAKYGALSGGSGTVDISWSLIGQDRLRLEWIESGGPLVQPPTQTGYGTKFIERAVVDELHGSYVATFPPEGMRCVIEIHL
jgi:two-component sensor histidine kinase